MRDHYDFADAKPAAAVPALARHQARNKGKTRITIDIDTDILDALRGQADTAGQGYQPMINAVLRRHLEHGRGEDLEAVLRRVIREEMKRADAAAG